MAAFPATLLGAPTARPAPPAGRTVIAAPNRSAAGPIPPRTGRAAAAQALAASWFGTSKIADRETVPIGLPSSSTTTLSESTVSIAASAS